jgi:hypothetical protein
VDVLSARYLRKLNGRNLMDFDSARPNECLPQQSLSLALDCHEAAAFLAGDPMQARLLTLAARIDEGFLGLDHDLTDPAKGFIFFCYTDTGKVRPREDSRFKVAGYSPVWGMRYGLRPVAYIALGCASRAGQLGDSPQGVAYRRLTVLAADVYLGRNPNLGEVEIWPMEYGMVIFLELAAHRMTGEEKYLRRARELADDAVRLYWDGSPLPRASSRLDHYEDGTCADTLAYALLALHEAVGGEPATIPISDLDR